MNINSCVDQGTTYEHLLTLHEYLFISNIIFGPDLPGLLDTTPLAPMF